MKLVSYVNLAGVCMYAECARMNARNMSLATNRFPPRQIYTGQVNELSSIQKPKSPKP